MEDASGVGKAGNANLVVGQGIVHPRGGFRAIGYGDQNGRSGSVFVEPTLTGGFPIEPENGVGDVHEIGKRILGFGFAVEIFFYFGVHVDVGEPRFIVFAQTGIVTNNDARSFDQTGLDSVVEAEIANDPSEEGFFAATPSGGSEGCGREVKASKDAAGTVNTVQAADPFGGLVDFFAGEALDGGLGWNAPGVMCFVIKYDDVLRSGHILQDFAGIGFIAESAAFVYRSSLGDLFVGVPSSLCQFRIMTLPWRSLSSRPKGMRWNSW